jgi:energy-coupling factor transport system substrate-specific component
MTSSWRGTLKTTTLLLKKETSMLNPSIKMSKLQGKDYIFVGIFTAIYLAITVLISAFAVLPILQILVPPLCALLSGPVYLLYLAKVGKPYTIIILGLICSAFVGLLVYGNVFCFLVNMVFFVAAEFIARSGGYKSFKTNAISYFVVSFWTMGESGTFWFFKDFAAELSLNGGYTQEWVDGVAQLSTPFTFIIIMAAIAVAALISIGFARSMFKKHFKKAGII